MKSFRKVILTVSTLAAFAPSRLFACAACYGRSSDPLAHGMNWGIFTLLGVVGTVMATIATFFIFLIRRETAMQAKSSPPQNSSPSVA